LRVDQQQRDFGRARGRDAPLDRRPEERLVDAYKGVIGSDLPDDEASPAGPQRAEKPRQGFGRQLSADARVPHIGCDAFPMGQFALQLGGVGMLGRTGPDALGRRRADGKDVQGLAGSRDRKRRPVRVECGSPVRAFVLVRAGGAREQN
jgi:hypothetical protein